VRGFGSPGFERTGKKNRIPALARRLDCISAEAGIQEMDRQISATPNPKDRVGLRLNKAVFLGVVKRIEIAREELKLAAKDVPDEPEVQLACDYIAGSLSHHEEKFADAYAQLTATLSKYFNLLQRADYRFVYEDVQEYRAFELVQMKDFEKAIPVLLEVLSFGLEQGGRSAALANLGICYAKLNDHERARQHLLEAIKQGELGEWEGQAHYHLGLTYARLNLLAESKQELQLCVRHSRDYGLQLENIYGWLSRICAGLGEKEEAACYAGLARPM
jgi:tetratricopeptide (TPR) repeat protein